MTRREFIAYTSLAPLVITGFPQQGHKRSQAYPQNKVSDFSKRLRPVGRILEMEGYYVWGTSPIAGPDGKIHVYFSRWNAQHGMGGWISRSEIAHAVADSPESPFQYVDTVFAPRGEGFWDGTTCHNPHIRQVDGKYCLFYIGNTNGKMDTQRIGLATADSPDGPWHRPDQPLLEVGREDAWDSLCTTNPSFVKAPDGQGWLYYKSLNAEDYFHYTDPKIRGNRKYGLAIAHQVEGPYIKYEHNPVIDFSGRGNNTQIEDGYVWIEDGKFKMIARDMGFFNHQYGIYLESEDGIAWSAPKIAFFEVEHYVRQPPAPAHLSKYGRFERPQLLEKDGKPAYLFLASQGGKYRTSSAFVFKIT